jgi:hypothetical protein
MAKGVEEGGAGRRGREAAAAAVAAAAAAATAATAAAAGPAKERVHARRPSPPPSPRLLPAPHPNTAPLQKRMGEFFFTPQDKNRETHSPYIHRISGFSASSGAKACLAALAARFAATMCGSSRATSGIDTAPLPPATRSSTALAALSPVTYARS